MSRFLCVALYLSNLISAQPGHCVSFLLSDILNVLVTCPRSLQVSCPATSSNARHIIYGSFLNHSCLKRSELNLLYLSVHNNLEGHSAQEEAAHTGPNLRRAQGEHGQKTLHSPIYQAPIQARHQHVLHDVSGYSDQSIQSIQSGTYSEPFRRTNNKISETSTFGQTLD